MTLPELKDWLEANNKEDRWILQQDGTISDEPISLDDVDYTVYLGKYVSIKILHLSFRNDENPQWIVIDDKSTKPSVWEKYKRPIMTALALMIMSSIAFIAVSNQRPQEVTKNKTGIDAWHFSQEFFQDQLKFPTGETFTSDSFRNITDLGDGRWKVESFIDFLDSNGVKKRTEFTCVVRRVGESWELENLDVDK